MKENIERTFEFGALAIGVWWFMNNATTVRFETSPDSWMDDDRVDFRKKAVQTGDGELFIPDGGAIMVFFTGLRLRIADMRPRGRSRAGQVVIKGAERGQRKLKQITTLKPGERYAFDGVIEVESEY